MKGLKEWQMEIERKLKSHARTEVSMPLSYEHIVSRLRKTHEFAEPEVSVTAKTLYEYFYKIFIQARDEFIDKTARLNELDDIDARRRMRRA